MIELLNRGGQTSIRVTGSSMLPTIWPGDMLTVRRQPMSEVRLRDIAMFARDGRLFVHRVIDHRGEQVVTQGDAVPSPDAPVGPSDLLGVVVAVYRNGRAVGVFAHLTLHARLIAALVRRSSRLSKILQRIHAVPWRAPAVAKAP